MFNVSSGVALVSQFGRVDVIQNEYKAQGDQVRDIISGTRINGNGETNANFTVNSAHHYVSVLAMLAPSADQMVGVSRLDLCNDDKWRRHVRVCAELFSTATKSVRVATPNSIQMNNCSFGYFEFKINDVCYNTGRYWKIKCNNYFLVLTGFELSMFTVSFCRPLDFSKLYLWYMNYLIVKDALRVIICNIIMLSLKARFTCLQMQAGLTLSKHHTGQRGTKCSFLDEH